MTLHHLKREYENRLHHIIVRTDKEEACALLISIEFYAYEPFSLVKPRIKSHRVLRYFINAFNTNHLIAICYNIDHILATSR